MGHGIQVYDLAFLLWLYPIYKYELISNVNIVMNKKYGKRSDMFAIIFWDLLIWLFLGMLLMETKYLDDNKFISKIMKKGILYKLLFFYIFIALL
jgi:hypothetical protein